MMLDELLSKETNGNYMEFTFKTSGKNLARGLSTLLSFKFVNYI